MTVPRWILITKDMATVRRDKEKETGKEWHETDARVK